MRPWESAVGTQPWELQQAVYVRTISVYRLPLQPSGSAGFGAQPYQEPQTANSASIWASAPIYSGVACSIQEETKGKESATGLPASDIVPYWRIFIPYGGLAKGSLKVHDYLMDEIGAKYRLTSVYWDALGYRAFAILEES